MTTMRVPTVFGRSKKINSAVSPFFMRFYSRGEKLNEFQYKCRHADGGCNSTGRQIDERHNGRLSVRRLFTTPDTDGARLRFNRRIGYGVEFVPCSGPTQTEIRTHTRRICRLFVVITLESLRVLCGRILAPEYEGTRFRVKFKR